MTDGKDSIQIQLENIGDELVLVDDMIVSTWLSISEFDDSDLQVIRDPGSADSFDHLLFDSLVLGGDDV